VRSRAASTSSRSNLSNHAAFGRARDQQRLLAEPVARQEQRLALAIPERERPHAAQLVERLRAVERQALEQHLGIRMRSQRDAAPFERRHPIAIVVDLAVLDDHVSPIGRAHGLSTALAQVDDREPRVSEQDPALGEQRLAIGPAMTDGREQQRPPRRIRRSMGEREHSRDAAHGLA